jgi:hypothetical protein
LIDLTLWRGVMGRKETRRENPYAASMDAYEPNIQKRKNAELLQAKINEDNQEYAVKPILDRLNAAARR